ncbi:2-hydroxyacid dehydrogenase [Echinicola vietnamensis]|uniref:Lactate dehydrogenase-like oxidoreductase n=1 Tax=Echinicola vietnamensis (strain DSM 17526 / LMG 23754 / KMM 6221) TaxID=926556 RepID=L0G566_ECHVK|nr:2-hydroxyacid dehydrogenase [Echinicola vietnamensis]AGA80146.1 lactate dehydrogenase-like oxidoreductase [Echinicola vietnamensis DSM 17526]
MKITAFSAHKFEHSYLKEALSDHELKLLEVRLTMDTVDLAAGSDAVAIFVTDNGSRPVLEKLQQFGVKYLALRSAGFNHVDLSAAEELGLKVARVPEYSPAAIAEHTVALMLALNRKLVKAHNRVRDLNFSLDGLVGFDMEGKTIGIAGTGKIGSKVAKTLSGFGCRLLAYDPYINESLKAELEIEYVDFKTLCTESDIITLHLPLSSSSQYMINSSSMEDMKKGVMLINTSRGALVNTKEVIEALKTGKIGSFGMDVYEEEEDLFFEDHSEDILQDDVIARLLTFQNVLITSHQAFLTKEALEKIAGVTAFNLNCWAKNESSPHELKGG